MRLHSKKSTNNQLNEIKNININMVSQDLDFEYYSNKELKKDGEKIKKLYDKKVNEHRKLWNQNRKKIHGKGFGKNQKSLSSFIFTFNQKMLDDWNTGDEELRKKIIQTGKETALDFAKQFNNEILYLTFHLDEKGFPHFQGMCTNYDKEDGRLLNIQTNKKNGEKCQDILFNHFEKLGHQRGISKEITKRRHIKTEEYQKIQDEKKLLNEENKLLKEDNKKLEKIKDDLILENKKINDEYNNILIEIFNDIDMLNNKDASKFTNVIKKILKKDDIKEKLEELKIKLGKKINRQSKKDI